MKDAGALLPLGSDLYVATQGGEQKRREHRGGLRESSPSLFCAPLSSQRSEHGGHKGYGLSAWVDVMTAVLSGANWGPHAPPFTLRGGVNADLGEAKVGKGIGHFFGAWRIAGFRPVDEFKSQMDLWIRTFRKTRPAAEHEAVRVESRDGVRTGLWRRER